MNVEIKYLTAPHDGQPGTIWDDFAERLRSVAAGQTDKRGWSLADTMAGRSVFDLPVSARPGGSGAAGGREKQKTENTGGPGGARALSAVRLSPKGAQE